LDTGIYLIRPVPLSPIKVNIPEVGQLFYIAKGEHAGFTHKIKPSFLEIQPTTTRFSVTTEVCILPPDVHTIIVEIEGARIDVSSYVKEERTAFFIESFVSHFTLETIVGRHITIDGPFSGQLFFQNKPDAGLVWYIPSNALLTKICD